MDVLCCLTAFVQGEDGSVYRAMGRVVGGARDGK